MKNESNQLDKYFISFVFMILFLVICMIYIKFLSVLLILPCSILVLIFLKYINGRDITVWQDSKKIIYLIVSVFLVLSFISKSFFQTFEFIEAFKGYFITNIIEVSDYEKIDYSKNLFSTVGYRFSKEMNRDLYITKSYDLEQTLKYADEIIGFLETPKLYEYSENIYHVKTNYNRKQKVTFIIHFLQNYNLIEIQT